ncbi:MAG: hypothetical protein QOE08_1849, partial [Thermoleophilaceae bacterium]|nr:hypothetical protein [Thermoleophilaceae bacterium]
PFCAGFILFAPDLVQFILGKDDWQPATTLLQGLAAAAALQQLGYNWFSFYRARGNPRPQAVESAVLAATFLGIAVPALFIWGFDGFVWGRIAGAALVLVVRLFYVRALMPGVSLLMLGARAALPVLGAAAVVLLARLALWSDHRSLAQAIGELIGFLALTALFTWLAERDLVRELATQVRAGGLKAGASRVAGGAAAS